MYGTSVFYFHFDINLIIVSFTALPYSLKACDFFIIICLFAGGYQVAVSKFFIIRMVKSSYPKTSSEFFINKIVKQANKP